MQVIIGVCHQSSHGYDQCAEVLGTSGMVATGNVYPNENEEYFKQKMNEDCEWVFDDCMEEEDIQILRLQNMYQ